MNHDSIIKLTKDLNVSVKKLRFGKFTESQMGTLFSYFDENISDVDGFVDFIYAKKKKLISLIETFQDFITETDYENVNGLFFQNVSVFSKNGKPVAKFHLPVNSGNKNLVKKLKKAEKKSKSVKSYEQDFAEYAGYEWKSSSELPANRNKKSAIPTENKHASEVRALNSPSDKEKTPSSITVEDANSKVFVKNRPFVPIPENDASEFKKIKSSLKRLRDAMKQYRILY